MSTDVMTQPTWNRLHVARRVRDMAKSMIRLSRLGRSIFPISALPVRERGTPLVLRFRKVAYAGEPSIASEKPYRTMTATASRVKTDAFGDALRVSPGQVAAFRLSRQHLATRAPASDLVRVAGDMAGAQAQVLSAAQMSLWARTADVAVADIEKALWQDRTLLKAWCMRGSLHLIPSDDFAVFVRGCARREARSADWFRRARIPMEPVNRIIEAVPSLLDEPLTRKEIGER